MRSVLRIWGWAIVCAFLLSFMVATHSYLSGFTDWERAFKFAVSDMLPWAILMPLVLRLADCLLLDRKNWPLCVTAHLLCALLCTMIVPVLTHAAAILMDIHPGGPPGMHGFPGPGGQPPFLPPSEDWPEPLPPWLHFAVIRAQFNFPIYCVIVIARLGWSYYHQAQERSRRAAELEGLLTKARLHNLRMQLHPHFLFNALHALSELVHSAPDRADVMIASLSELLRLSLRDAERTEITLREELEVLDSYLDIQQMRFGERLIVERRIDPETLSAAVPSFLLQPLVENVVKHVLEKRTLPVHVRLESSRKNGQLMLRLLDDGPGLGTENRPLVEGVGLANTRARLAALHGPAHSLTLRNRPEGGLEVCCLLPFHEAAQAPST